MVSEHSSEAISQVFDDWLSAEVRSSAVEVNSYLDEYKTAIKGLKGGYGHEHNFLARKHEGHVHVRLPQAWETFTMSLEPGASEAEKEYQSAWLLFTPLMQVSGTYRAQCWFEASDGNDYLDRRQSRPSGIDMQKTVADRLKVWLSNSDNFAGANITTEDLHRQLKLVSKAGETSVKRVCARAVLGFDFGERDSRSSREMVAAQYNWASFATDCLILAAKMRKGELAAVPFLEPKSISSDPPPEVIYPLAA